MPLRVYFACPLSHTHCLLLFSRSLCGCPALVDGNPLTPWPQAVGPTKQNDARTAQLVQAWNGGMQPGAIWPCERKV